MPKAPSAADTPPAQDTPALQYGRMHVTVADCAKSYTSAAAQQSRAELDEHVARYGPGA